MPIRPWFEFESFVPGARNLQRCGAHWPGNGRTGFYIPDEISTADPEACRDAISGPWTDRALAVNAAARLSRCPDGYRGIDWSGHVLFRQAMAALGKPVHPNDRVDHIAHIGPAMDDVLTGLEGRLPEIAYINHEAGLEPEFVGSLLKAVLPFYIPTMVTGVTCGLWPMFCWYGEVRRSSVEIFLESNLRPYVEAWISRRPIAGARLSSAWNGLIDTVNQIASVRRSFRFEPEAEVRPVPSVRGVIGTHYKDRLRTTEHEQAVYRVQALAMSALGVTDVIVFNSVGRGEHLKDPAVDFSVMADEDLRTMQVFEDANVPELDFKHLPKEPITYDTEAIKLGDLVIRYADLPVP